ncbi:MAG: ATP-binding protein [Alphaproteobacteria bacterium]|nr:ATP-binding protein [Alphaproteobacteria bacterium]MDP6622280.1 ATP-binding protein [Alphaproteobacteria bacterium]
MPVAMTSFGQIGRLETSQPSTGLGLSLMATMVELHGGRLELASRRGEGTSATLDFPPDRILDNPDRLRKDAVSSPT